MLIHPPLADRRKNVHQKKHPTSRYNLQKARVNKNKHIVQIKAALEEAPSV